MDSEKVGKFIKELRVRNNLTQADLAKKYGVTYQAVSKWENGINLPDITLLKEMSKDFEVNIEDILAGEIKTKKKSNNKASIFIIIILLLLIILFIMFFRNDSDFAFKTITTTCKEFKVTGTIAYDTNKSSINISNINYCGGEDNTIYDNIACELYEEENNEKSLISKCNKIGNKQKLEEYLKEVEIKVDNYKQKCKSYSHNNLYLEIKATIGNKVTLYKVDLNLNNNCDLESEG